ncbi:MAG: 4-alpha-glucanotransferase [Micrococcales bacterium 73-15]|uniref:4-alpha-glucanotransferase n=1 Tax=Salana multivorans TaxID=120377 RepID=UPI00095F8D79|nr:4-alpha-glucanotransferase [Salana multivorans]OJX98066.1 MAG: 4-alpha-glucanotransferase [Micrococcales bacterium 73-15]
MSDASSGTLAQVGTPPSPELAALAEAHGVASEYWSFFGERVHVPAETLRLVLAAMGIHADTPDQVALELAEVEQHPWRDLLPPSLVVVREHDGVRATLVVNVHDRHDVDLTLHLEDGTRTTLAVPDQVPQLRDVDGVRIWRLEVPLPADLPYGWHEIRAVQRRQGGGGADRRATCVLAVTPRALTFPDLRPGYGGRGWGLMAQLYSVRSRQSWGIGDFADLADLAEIAGGRGADFLLINPVHAGEAAGPIEPSPYLPTTRRFISPLYIRPEDVREAAYLPSNQRALVEWAHEDVAPANLDPLLLDRDAAWSAKKGALEVIFTAPRSASRQRAFAAFRAREGRALEDFALFCAIEEHYYGTERPAGVEDVRSAEVARLRRELADRVEFYAWLQWVADEQLGDARTAGERAGMGIGIMHDLAVGVHPEGSDAWSLQHMYARRISVGAPPDMYNQQGQDWSQPPWRPDMLAREGYAPLRDMVRSLLRHAGALRIDHVLGFFRLWWIPSGAGAANGTYVRYDHEAMIGVLVLEAYRAGAVIIGEDLGNVEPWVRDYLSSRGILGTSVLWFEDDGGRPRPPEHYRELLLATVNTHDLPPTAGYLAGEHVDLRQRLGLLTEPVEQVRAAADAERESMLAFLRERRLIGEHASEREIVEALHVLLVAAPSRLLGVALVDAVGERRAQNQPGTHREYPNWSIPLADSAENVVLVDDLDDVARFASLTGTVDAAMRRVAAERGDRRLEEAAGDPAADGGAGDGAAADAGPGEAGAPVTDGEPA